MSLLARITRLMGGASVAAAALSFAPASALGGTSPVRPNVVVVLLDDMGFSDIGCYGGDVKTPNLDTLAAQGVRFTNFRNAARCCPTRGSILTGLYPHQAGLGGMEGPRKQGTGFTPYKGALHENCVTIAEVLKPRGYRTYAVGKWHVGFPENGSSPMQRGFDHWLGVYEGWADYNTKVVEKRMLVEDDVVVEKIPEGFKNITYLYSDKAIEYATSDPSTPFFLYLPHIAPHFNLGPLPENVARYKGVFDEGWDVLRARRLERQKQLGLFPSDTELAPRHHGVPAWDSLPTNKHDTTGEMKYAAAIDEVDQGVGKLVEALKKTGQWENTLFLFMSDNGAPVGNWGVLDNAPFNYFKQQLFEGGMMSPLIAVWPGRIPAGKINHDQYGHVKDIMATVVDATGATYPTEFKGKPIFPLEGRSLLPAMLDPAVGRDPGVIGWEHQGHRALLADGWKIVSLYKEDTPEFLHTHMQAGGRGLELALGESTGERTGKWHLYHLAKDRTETQDLADQMPAKVAEMEKLYFEWAARTKVMEREELNKAWNLDAKKKKQPAASH